MKIVVVDDEELALKRVERILNELGYECDTYNDSTELDLDIPYDIYFLDIEMPEISGIELAKKITAKNEKAFIVFQTAYDEYALEAFEIGAINYILKPYTIEQVQNAIDRAKSFRSELDEVVFRTKNGNESYIVKSDDIIYIEANLTETMIRTKDGFSYYGKKISEMEKLLEKKNFFRIHRSVIINMDKIKNMETIEQSKLEFFFYDVDDVVTSSKDGAKKFRDYIQAGEVG